MSEFKSYSQAGQDRFVWELLGPGPGTFLDIGANDPVVKSNTWALEKAGWRGALVESDPECAGRLRDMRGAVSAVIEQDATKVDWRHILGDVPCVDYLSLDVDEASLKVLRKLMASGLRFRVLTVEHDAYRFGWERPYDTVGMLEEQGYRIVCPEVCDQGMSFETWAVAADVKVPARWFTGEARDWKWFFE